MDPSHCLELSFPYPGALYMILIAIFSIIVLLMCWLCYHGEQNN